ncbi:MAG TPA: type II secretion system F family protein [Candidatus Deferrimicrobiaceae bacterium]|jgi:tight adherence protein C
MKSLEPILIAVLFFSGICFLAWFWSRLDAGPTLRRLKERYVIIHKEITNKMIVSGMIAIPGIRLVDPVKSWLCAEVASICVATAQIAYSPRSPGYLLAIAPLSLFFGASTLLISLKSESSGIISTFQQDLPLASFLMSLLIESGMGASSAMQETVGALPPRSCASELREMLRGRELGVPKHEMFEGSRVRVPLDDYRAFLNLIEQGERLGIGLSQGLNELSGRILESQAHRAEMLAQQAAVKMLLPLVLFIFPAVFLIVLSPVILNLCGMAGW